MKKTYIAKIIPEYKPQITYNIKSKDTNKSCQSAFICVPFISFKQQQQQRMRNIKLLPDNVIDQIAAGEIIERPASVVKELIENAIDAKASRITVEIEGGGKKLIRITDNGIGMNRSNLSLCFQRFATSKIEATSDLLNVKSYGFRGEALPSIASVSHMTILTKALDENNAFSIAIKGSKTEDIIETNRQQGTTITVKNLFFNIPARLKFLKTDNTEKRKILLWIESISLAHPAISFTVLNEGKKVLTTSSRESLNERFLEIYGLEFMKNICLLNYSFSKGEIKGMISEPSHSRRDRSGIKTFVNGRLVQNRILNYVVNQFYRDKMPHGNFPYVVLLIEIEKNLVDVNVHPSKQEIRFINEGIVIANCLKAFELALSKKIEVSLRSPSFKESNFPFKQESNVPSESIPANIDEVKSTLFNQLNHDSVNTLQYQASYYNRKENNNNQGYASLSTDEHVEGTQAKLIGQIKNRYLIIELENDVALLDQHASHERILYEKAIKENITSISQSLLFPETIDFTLEDFGVLEDNIEKLNNLGFSVSLFGTNTIKIDSVPSEISGKSLKKYFLALIAYLKDKTYGKPGLDKLIRGVCRQSVMFGDPLTTLEQEKLVSDLFKCQNPYSCPHGRPTMFKISFSEIDRKLGR